MFGPDREITAAEPLGRHREILDWPCKSARQEQGDDAGNGDGTQSDTDQDDPRTPDPARENGAVARCPENAKDLQLVGDRYGDDDLLRRFRADRLTRRRGRHRCVGPWRTGSGGERARRRVEPDRDAVDAVADRDGATLDVVAEAGRLQLDGAIERRQLLSEVEPPDDHAERDGEQDHRDQRDGRRRQEDPSSHTTTIGERAATIGAYPRDRA